MIIDRIEEKKQAKIKQWPVQSNRASLIGHECERYLVYKRLYWEKETLHDVRLQYIFDEGRRQEQATIDDLREAGFEILEAQRPFADKDLQLTGHIDFKLKLDGKLPPVEVKGLSPFTWEKINTFEDIIKSDKPYVRKYAAQMTLYLYLGNAEEGWLLLRNKLTGQYKEILVKLDWDFADSLIKKIQRINQCVGKKELPEGVNEYKICKDCGFQQMCMPDIVFGEGIGFLKDEEVINLLNHRAELAEQANEYRAVDKELKEGLKNYMKERQVLIAGEWIIEKKVNKKGAISFDISRNGPV